MISTVCSIFSAKSERFVSVDPLQCTLDLGMPPATTQPAKVQTITYNRKKPDTNKTPHGRDEIPSHLPRTIVELKPAFDTNGLEKIGEKVTEELEYNPPTFTVTRYVRPVYKKIENDQSVILCDELPPRCIDKGKAGPSLVAHTIISKCVDHQPLHRLKQIIKRECKLDIPESTLHGWFDKGIFWLEPIAKRCEQLLLTSTYIQMDESTLSVMIQPTNGSSTQGNMIVRHAVKERIILFDYQRYKNTEVLSSLLSGFAGVLQTDGLEQYNSICNNNPLLIHAGCLDHCRRGLEKSLTNDKNRAEHALNEFKLLYAVEELARKEHLDDSQRLLLRKEQSQPVLNRLFEWMKQEVVHLRPKDLLAKAIFYALNREKELSLFLIYGFLELSNILLENCIRPLALGRRNFLFAGSENGARKLAIAYSIFGMCKLNHINPSIYLPFVFKELPKRSAHDIDDLLPPFWKPPNS